MHVFKVMEHNSETAPFFCRLPVAFFSSLYICVASLYVHLKFSLYIYMSVTVAPQHAIEGICIVN